MILIISESLEPTTNEICKWLNFYNVKWFRINEEDYVRIEKIEISNEKIEFILKLNNESFIRYSDITFVYYRRGIINLELPSENTPTSLRKFLLQERLNIIEFLHSRLELKNSLGKFEKHGANKLSVLAKAIEVGLKIPTSYILTEMESVREIISNDSFITKAIFEAISFKEDNVGYSNPTSEVNLLQIPEHTRQLFPSLIQKNIPKDYELRTVFIDGDFVPRLFREQFNNNLYQSISFSLNIPIFNKNATRNQVKVQELELQSLYINKQSEYNQLKQKMEQLSVDILNTSSQLEALEKVHSSALLNYENFQVRYETGNATYTQLIEAENKLIRSDSERIQVKYQLLFKQTLLGFYVVNY